MNQWLKPLNCRTRVGWIKSDGNRSAIHIFDGQHKAAAQIMLGAKSLPVRVFIDPDPDTLSNDG
jgi:hypothetical protein